MLTLYYCATTIGLGTITNERTEKQVVGLHLESFDLSLTLLLVSFSPRLIVQDGVTFLTGSEREAIITSQQPHLFKPSGTISGD